MSRMGVRSRGQWLLKYLDVLSGLHQTHRSNLPKTEKSPCGSVRPSELCRGLTAQAGGMDVKAGCQGKEKGAKRIA